ncbi:MAG: hypothetical protein FWD69_00760 [Polyangiaceae bacterium]|nr:hypothetical protein [Polyangiaceae bacterium]
MEIDTARLRMSFIDEGRGTTVVLLHPFPLSAEVFRADADLLSDAMRVIAPSMRGFGTTTPFDTLQPPSIDAMADDVASLLDALGIRERVLSGPIRALAALAAPPSPCHVLVRRAKRPPSCARTGKARHCCIVDLQGFIRTTDIISISEPQRVRDTP